MIPVASVIAFPSHYANVDWPHQLTPSAEDQKKARDKASASVEEQKKDLTEEEVHRLLYLIHTQAHTRNPRS